MDEETKLVVKYLKKFNRYSEEVIGSPNGIAGGGATYRNGFYVKDKNGFIITYGFKLEITKQVEEHGIDYPIDPRLMGVEEIY